MTVTKKISLAITGIIIALLIYLLAPILEPFLIAALLAYLGDPLVNYLTRFKISRTWAASLVFITIMLIIVSAFLFVVPLLIKQINILIDFIPQVVAWIQQYILPWLHDRLDVSMTFNLQDIKNTLTKHWQQAGDIVAVVWTTLSSSTLAVLEFLTKLLLIPVVTFYLLRDWPKLMRGIQRLIPRRIEPRFTQLFTEFDEVLGAFFRGQLLVMLALAIIYSIGLAIVGIKLAVLLGILIGILAIVPYLGTIVGIVTASAAALLQFHDWTYVLYVVIVFAVAVGLEQALLVPWLVGDRIGLHPVAVIFAVLAGGQLFGFMGVLLALPVAAIIMVVLRHMRRTYLKSGVYK